MRIRPIPFEKDLERILNKAVLYFWLDLQQERTAFSDSSPITPLKVLLWNCSIGTVFIKFALNSVNVR